MASTLTFSKSAWAYTNDEGVMPPNTHGRFVYVYVKMNSVALYVMELEVFAPFNFGE